jgi:hypothetical protein
LLFVDFTIPFIEDVQKKVKLLVFFVEFMPVEFLHFETRVWLGLKEVLDIFIYVATITDVDNAL